MSKEDKEPKLLSEQELNNEVDILLLAHKNGRVTAEQGAMQLVKLIQSQKLAHGNMVIGTRDQEYRLVDTEYAHPRKKKVFLYDNISKNKLRAEQRKRNKV